MTGLYYYDARYYDPELGRFITEDPVQDGWNWYVYAVNNPLRYVDPDGLMPMDVAQSLFGYEPPEAKVTKIGIDIYGHYIYGGGAELAFISDIQGNIGLLITPHTDVNITTPYKFNFSAVYGESFNAEIIYDFEGGSASTGVSLGKEVMIGYRNNIAMNGVIMNEILVGAGNQTFGISTSASAEKSFLFDKDQLFEYGKEFFNYIFEF